MNKKRAVDINVIAKSPTFPFDQLIPDLLIVGVKPYVCRLAVL